MIRKALQTGLGPENSSIPGSNLGLFHLLLAEPVGGNRLGFGIEGDAVLSHHMEITVEGILMAAERKDRYRYRNAHVNTDHAGVSPLGEFAGIVTVLGEDR